MMPSVVSRTVASPSIVSLLTPIKGGLASGLFTSVLQLVLASPLLAESTVQGEASLKVGEANLKVTGEANANALDVNLAGDVISDAGNSAIKNPELSIKKTELSLKKTELSLKNREPSARLTTEIKSTLGELFQQSTSSERLAKEAAALLVFPNIIKAAIGLGGEYGEGVLVINNQIADYYSVKGLSLGIQFGVHSKSLVVIFLDASELNNFRVHSGWKLGIDGALTLATLGVAGEVDSLTSRKSNVGYVFNSRGLIYDVSIKGAKFSKIPPEKMEQPVQLATQNDE